MLNTYFAEIGKNIVSNLPASNRITFEKYLIGSYNRSMYISLTTEQEILSVYKNCSNSSAFDFDGFSKRIFDSILILS